MTLVRLRSKTEELIEKIIKIKQENVAYTLHENDIIDEAVSDLALKLGIKNQ